MKKIYMLVTVTLALTLTSCEKDSDQVCYECDIDMNGNFRDQGCYTREQWDGITFRINNDNDVLDKSRYCRKR